MRLSKRCEYGIKASVRLSSRQPGVYVQSRELAEAELLPAKFLESILLVLRSAQILESKVGAGGGYRLARPAEAIRVSELIAALDPDEEKEASAAARTGPLRPGQAALDLLHDKIDKALDETLGSLSLAELAAIAEERAGSKDRSMYYI